MLVVGLMSGTSLDGVDGVLARFGADGGVEQLLAHAFEAFEPQLRAELMALQTSGVDELHRASLAANALVDAYAVVVDRMLEGAAVRPGDVACIAAHGQTVRHRPELGYTIQLNAPARLAERTGIAVVADFRSRDVAAGGHGAPLVPAFHRALFGSAITEATRLVVNLGGFANVTRLDADGTASGHDLGPANVLLDLWVERHLGTPFDRNGAWASIGQVDQALLDRLMADPWFALTGPRSTGRDRFNAAWLDRMLDDGAARSPEDVQRTLLELTVETIVRDIVRVLDDALRVGDVVLCGGGARNATLVETLAGRLAALDPAPRLRISGELGVAPEHVEALAFAWLGWAHLEKKAGNLPAVTGARGERVLGIRSPG